MRVVRARPRLLVQPRHGLEIVVHHVGRRFGQDVEGALEAATKIRHQDLDPRGGRYLAHLADAIPEMPRAAVAQVIAVHAGDDDVREPEGGDRLGEIQRLVGIQRQRTAMRDVAERATPRADIAHDHEGRRALAKTFADVRTGGFFADRVQMMLAQDLLDLVEARARRRAHADPVGLFQPLGHNDLDRDARGLGPALLLDAGRVGWDRRRDVAHAARSGVRCVARIGARSPPASSTLRATPKSESCVTASPGYPQGSISAKGERSMATLTERPW